MAAAGFILAGGASSRMGTNKAFLKLGNSTFIEIAIAALYDALQQAPHDAIPSVTIIGQPLLYTNLSLPVIPDIRPNTGPLAGIETALIHTGSEWNLVLACDMPRITSAMLRRILAEAETHPAAGCVLPQNAQGLVEPLCAAYSKRMLPFISEALARGVRKVTGALPPGLTYYLPVAGDPAFQNVNTPEEYGRTVSALH